MSRMGGYRSSFNVSRLRLCRTRHIHRRYPKYCAVVDGARRSAYICRFWQASIVGWGAMRDDAVLDDAAVVARLRAAGCVFAEEEAELLLAAARSRDELAGFVERRAAGEP